MGLFSTIKTALMGHANNLGEAIEDKNTDVILDQSVREMQAEHEQTTRNVAKLDAQRKSVERDVKALLAKKESAMKAIQKAQESKDDELVNKLLTALENEVMLSLKSKQGQLAQLVDAVDKNKAGLKIIERKMNDFKTRVEIAKTQAQVNKVTEQSSASVLNNATASSRMNKTLERAEKRVSEKGDYLDSLSDLESPSSSLDALLEENTESLSAEERIARLQQ